MDQRACARANLVVPVELTAAQHPVSHNGRTCNIGTDGLFIAAAVSLANGEEIDLAMQLPHDRRRLKLRCRVARVARNGYGLRFSGLAPNQRELLASLAEAHWDGRDILDGLLLATTWQPAWSLPEMLRLTAVVERHFRPLCHRHSH